MTIGKGGVGVGRILVGKDGHTPKAFSFPSERGHLGVGGRIGVKLRRQGGIVVKNGRFIGEPR